MGHREAKTVGKQNFSNIYIIFVFSDIEVIIINICDYYTGT